jgi:hypothetical protein
VAGVLVLDRAGQQLLNQQDPLARPLGGRDGARQEEPVTVRLGVWISNTKTRRDKLNTEQLTALAEVGMDWAQPVTVPRAAPDSL